jgi:lipopolysaccharide/colanic/teichoic acid biosynthesis glycosyltransferase
MNALAAHRPDHSASDAADVPSVQPMETIFVQPSPGWKRACDILVAGAALIVLLPFMLAIAIAIRIDSPGPVIFRQRRAGLGGKPFTLYKFRSMVPDAELRKAQLLARNERSGPAFKMKHDPRVTKFGRFIRSTSIDELPQLLNVLKGEMCLVGPRPLPVDETSNCDSWQKRRLDVKPGITCIWQVTSRHDADFDNWARLDIRYARQQSFLFDLKLLLATVPAVLLRRGAC